MLIVDDEKAIGFALSRYFESKGFRVDVATNLLAARSRIATHPYGIVLADLRLYGTRDQEGLELLDYLKRLQPRARCVLLSAYANPEMERAAIERGAALVLRKPIGMPELWQHVRVLLEQ